MKSNLFAFHDHKKKLKILANIFNPNIADIIFVYNDLVPKWSRYWMGYVLKDVRVIKQVIRGINEKYTYEPTVKNILKMLIHVRRDVYVAD